MTWFMIQGYEGLYDIDDSLQVRNSKNLKILPCKSGHVTLCKNGTPSRVMPRTLIATIEVGTSSILKRSVSQISEGMVKHRGVTSHAHLSSAGKALVCFSLLCRGLESIANDETNGAWDVKTIIGGRELTIAVRTTSGPYRDGRVTSYQFSKCAVTMCDLFAYVAVDSKCVMLELPESEQDNRTFVCSKFIADAESSIDQVLTRMTENVNLPEWLR